VIPLFSIISVQAQERKRIRLWIPLFLLWILVLLLSPLLLALLLVYCAVGRVNPLRAVSAFWALGCGLAGTHIEVNANSNNVLVRIL
jgi:ABC-type arginine/histidine transport system permease subunit